MRAEAGGGSVSHGGGGGDEPVGEPGSTTAVILFYTYRETDAQAEADQQRADCERLGLLGRLLVAGEGLNGTLAGPPGAVSEYVDDMVRRLPGLSPADFKASKHAGPAAELFPDLQVRAVQELISSGGAFSGIPLSETGRGYLSPAEFHAALGAPDTLVLDCRNHKEVMIGHFDGALDPGTRTWAEWPAYVRAHVEQFKGKRVLMYCTGGVRCEKASAFLRRTLAEAGDRAGAEGVRHLRGGIHKYLEAFPDGGKFRGKNFVFDNRLAMAAAGGGEVVGACLRCGAPHDAIAHDAICTVCRDPVLACGRCRAAARELHCEAHAYLADCYFTDLSPFCAEELTRQRADLQGHHDAIAVGKAQRNRRRMLRNQLARVDAALEAIHGGGTPVAPQGAAAACRSCGLHGCSGACWGFHGRRRLKAGGQPGAVRSPPAPGEGKSNGGEPKALVEKVKESQDDDTAGLLCYDASHVAATKGAEAAEALMVEAARRLGAALDAAERTLAAPRLSLEAPEVARLRGQGVLLWSPRKGGPMSRREARRMAKAERSRDPGTRAARKAHREALRSQQPPMPLPAEKALCGLEERYAELMALAGGAAVHVGLQPLPRGGGATLRLVAPYPHLHRCAAKARWVGRPLEGMLVEEFAHMLPADYWTAVLEAGLVTVNGQAVSMAGRSSPLRASDEVAHMMLRHEPPVWLPAGGLPAGVAVEWHGDIGVVNKPPGLPVHPCGAYHHNSLATLLGLQLGDGPPLHFPHRLDTVTSGLLLVARSKVAARRLARQLEPGAKGGGATKLYAARVRGDFLASFPSGHASCSEPVLTQPGRAESICHPDGKAARTGFAFMGHAPDGTSLLQCCPATGRTHQIRLHLAALGHPIANDLLYAGGDSAELAEAAGECQARWEAEQVAALRERVSTGACAAALDALIDVDVALVGGPRALFADRQLVCPGIWLHAYRCRAPDGQWDHRVPLPCWATVPQSAGDTTAGTPPDWERLPCAPVP